MSGNFSYIHVLQSSLPKGYIADLTEDTQSIETLKLIDYVLRFTCGGACPDDASDKTRKEWDAKQEAVKKALQALSQDKPDGKRKREEDVDVTPEAKRTRVSEDNEDAPLYTLHAISVSSPIRKKVDITIHDRSLRLVHPSTTVSVSRSSVTHAFLVPTRGKAKPHWTVVVLTDDLSESAKVIASSTQKTKTPEKTQIVFGIEAAPSAAFMTSTYSTPDAPLKETYPKNTPALPVLRVFLERLGVVVHEPSTSVFKSTIPDMMNPGESGSPSLTAYLGAKPGTLYFFDSGLLWGETKPFMWWPLEELAPIEEDEGSLRGGVRVVWAGGRLCTIVLSRGMEDGEEDGKQELDEGEETHLGMVDAKEKEGVEEWVRKHKRWFGKGRVGRGAAAAATNGVDKGKGKAVAVNGKEEEDVGDSSDDEEDEDFEDDSGSDGGSPSESSSDEGGGEEGGGQEEEEDEEGEEDEDAEGEDEEESEMDPARHPLLRPGAMPKMSKGVIDMVAGIVEQEFLGVGDDQADDEEDELDD
ncbi:hypothetical protein NEOLEDRAFT_1066134 [Neolentinus lepideus HHB14362 ss-1]|uniref:Histone chaperone RTT106/FACT complex subunit SPT16-like middle domain-containing protein n=1 Tax=Neolentinus lepideus HHB14362 ss-1 TaxID=1314782 RepID=A0A165SFS4_9AGAM|nr:hypothetical protein NEOLEDRAFT_1066134 [Neolentinus lepideus HHB14362 ss-1]